MSLQSKQKLVSLIILGIASTSYGAAPPETAGIVPFIDNEAYFLEEHTPEAKPQILNLYSRWIFKSLDKEVDCLAKNIYFESWQEERKGQIAVALVTLNRVKSGYYPSSICDVVWQQTKNRRGKRVAQFSWTLDGRADVPKNETAWEQSLELAREILANGSLDNFTDFTRGATHYHAVYVHPKWRKQMEKVMKIGLHIFYRDPKLAVDISS